MKRHKRDLPELSHDQISPLKKISLAAWREYVAKLQGQMISHLRGSCPGKR